MLAPLQTNEGPLLYMKAFPSCNHLYVICLVFSPLLSSPLLSSPLLSSPLLSSPLLSTSLLYICACLCGLFACAHTHLALAYFRYKYQRWLAVSSVWIWQLLFVVVDRLLVNGWRFEVPSLSLCDGYRALLWMRIPVHGAPLSASMHRACVASTGCFSERLWDHRVMGRLNMVCFFELLIFTCCCWQALCCV